jgi:hypothetical protein
MRTDSIDVESLISYIKDIKPFHSKLTNVSVEYQVNDNLYVSINDSNNISVHLSSIWELQRVSDGVRTQYRIPAAVFPRHSDSFHQCNRIGIIDEVPGEPGVYPVPFNNGVNVSVNGIPKYENIDYILDAKRTTIKFINLVPILADKICINWKVIDRLFIGIAQGSYDTIDYDTSGYGDEIVWQNYDLEIDSVSYEGSILSTDQTPVIGDIVNSVKLLPFGEVKIITNETGQDYYVFNFFQVISLDTKIWIRVEQREAYNGWTQTRIKESVQFRDVVRFHDIINAQIVDPGTWNVNEELFGINISSGGTGLYDIDGLDLVDYDSSLDIINIGYYRLFNIHEILSDTISNTTFDHYSDLVNEPFSEYIETIINDSSDNSISAFLSELAISNIIEFPDIGYDNNFFDTIPYDVNIIVPLILINISKNSPIETSITGVSEDLSISITTLDDEVISYRMYYPNSNGMVYVNSASSIIEIIHDYGYNPLLVVYFNNQQIIPLEINYPQIGTVIVKFTEPKIVTIHLA